MNHHLSYWAGVAMRKYVTIIKTGIYKNHLYRRSQCQATNIREE
jgi:hypothetical protein